MISSELLTDLLYPEGDILMGPLAHGRMQALLDAVPVGLLEFRLEEDGLYLWASNAAARRMPGLGLVREEGVLAQVVFDQLAHTALDAVTQGRQPHAGKLRQRAGAFGQGAPSQLFSVQLGHALPP